MRTGAGLWALVTAAYAVLVVGSQWSTLGQEVIDWDESTFILLADRLAGGHLPYVDLYDNKPPFMFVALAGVIYVFGDSLIAIRIFGDLCLLISGLLVFAIARPLTDTVSAICGGALLIVVCALREGQYTSTELLAVAMLLGALWLLLFRREQSRALALAGLLISLATLTRTNLALIAVAYGAYIAIIGVPSGTGRRRLRPLIVYTLAGLVPPAIFALIYWNQDALGVFWLANVTVPLNYAGGQVGFFDALTQHADMWLDKILRWPLWIGGYTAFALAGFVVAMTRLGRGPGKTETGLILIMFAAAAVSVLQSGAVYPHYLLQVFPFGAIFGAYAVHALRVWPVTVWLGPAMVAGLCLVVLERFGPNAARSVLVPGFVSDQHHVRQAADRVRSAVGPEDQIWAVSDHLILWYLDHPPISKVTAHPSNVARQAILGPLVAAGYVPADVLQGIYESRPAFVVTDRTGVLPEYLPDLAYFEAYLSESYAVFLSNEDLTIYRRIGHRGWDGTPAS